MRERVRRAREDDDGDDNASMSQQRVMGSVNAMMTERAL